jgi:hypothetical protein
MKRLIATLITLAPLATIAAESHFVCPERYPLQNTELGKEAQPGEGALGMVSGSLLLIGGGMISGSPKEEIRAELRGSDEPSKAGRSETRFPAIGETWAACFYGRAGEVQLFHRVDGPGVRECTVVTVRRKVRAPEVNVACW